MPSGVSICEPKLECYLFAMTDKPPSLPRLALIAIQRLFADEAVPLAGNIAFRMLFSIFPFLIFMTALAGFFGNAMLAEQIVNFLLGVVPAQIVDPLAPEIRSILTVPRTGLLSLAALLTIWSAMAGVDSVRVGLNRAYNVRETRNLFLLYAIGIVFVIGSAFLMLVVALLLVVAPLALEMISRYAPTLHQNVLALQWLRYPVAMLLLLCGLQLAHHVLPNKRQKFRHVLPGVVVTVVVWMVLSAAFSAYLVNFNSFASTYASLSGLFAAMFFLYLSALVLILGGEFNSALRLHRSARKPPDLGKQS
jgi:membrane protein